ncbi:MAG: putative molybdenum carrier protein [Desulfobacterales bacterium]|jgi:hypothetical protein
MIRKIISCGVGSAATAAMEAARKLGLSFGGWIPEGTPGEDGGRSGPENIRQTGIKDPDEAFRRNVMEADATVMITEGPADSIIEGMKRICEQAGRPVLHLALDAIGGFQAARELGKWVQGLRVNVLHVAGHPSDTSPNLARNVLNLLEAFFYLNLMKDGGGSSSPPPFFLDEAHLPRTVAEAVESLKKHLPLKDKTTVANMSEQELPGLDPTLGEYIRNAFHLWSGNYALLDSCRLYSRDAGLGKADAAAVIILELWRELKRTHTLRVVK